MSDDDVNCLVRELDVLWNGESGAAKQASLCDMLSQIDEELPALRKDAERYRWIDEHGLTELLVALEKNPRSLDETIDAAMKEEGK